MSHWFNRHVGKIRIAFVVLVALQAAACGSSQQRAESYYQSGMTLLAAKNNQKAAIEFRNALRLKRDLLPAWRGLAQADEAIHHLDGLVQDLQAILDLDPKDTPTRLKLARLLLAAGAVDQSLQVVNEAGQPDSADAKLIGLKALIHYKLKDSDSANREAQSALNIEPGNPDALIVLAADRLANNDPNGALQMLSGSNSSAQKPDLETELFKLKIYAQVKDYAKLEALLKNLAQHYPQDIAFRKELVNLYTFQRRSEDAEKELRAIAASDPKNSQFGLEVVQFLYRMKGPAAAREELVADINAGGNTFPYQLALAQLDYDQGKIDDSFKLLETLGQSTTLVDALKAKVLLAQLNLRQKNIDATEKIVADILARDKRNTDALKLRASIRLDRNQLDAAILDLREALNDQPRSSDLMLLLASAYERSGSIDLADEQFADALKASNFNPDVGLSYVAFLRRRGGADRAYDVLTELASRWPNNIPVLSALAEAKLVRQDWASAQQIAEMIRRLGDADDVADQILGVALGGEHDSVGSITAFQNSVAAAPQATQPMATLVVALIKAKQTDKAVAFLQSTLEKDPKAADAYVLLGDIELSNNNPDQAKKDFEAAIDNQPMNNIGYRALAGFYVRQKSFETAFDVLESGIKQMPDSQALHLALAGTLDLKGDFEGAISQYEYLLKQEPGSMLIINNLASLLAEHRTDKASLDQAKSLAVSLQDSPIAQFKDTLGWVDYREGDFKDAVPLLEAAAAALPDLALVHYHLGMSYIGIGQTAKASDELKLAINGTSNSDLEGKIRAGIRSIVTQ